MEEVDTGQFWTPFPVTDVCEQLPQYTRKKQLYSQQNTWCYPSGSMWGGSKIKAEIMGKMVPSFAELPRIVEELLKTLKAFGAAQLPGGCTQCSHSYERKTSEVWEGSARNDITANMEGNQRAAGFRPAERRAREAAGPASANRKRRPARSISPFQPRVWIQC